MDRVHSMTWLCINLFFLGRSSMAWLKPLPSHKKLTWPEPHKETLMVPNRNLFCKPPHQVSEPHTECGKFQIIFCFILFIVFYLENSKKIVSSIHYVKYFLTVTHYVQDNLNFEFPRIVNLKFWITWKILLMQKSRKLNTNFFYAKWEF